MAEKVSLLRRPRPPKQPKTLRVLMSYQNIESPASPSKKFNTFRYCVDGNSVDK